MKSRKAEKSGVCAVYSSNVSVTNITHYGATLPLFLKKKFVYLLGNTFTLLHTWMKWRANLLMY